MFREGDLALRIDYTIPWNVGVRRKIFQCLSDEARSSNQSTQTSNFTVRCYLSFGNMTDDLPDNWICTGGLKGLHVQISSPRIGSRFNWKDIEIASPISLVPPLRDPRLHPFISCVYRLFFHACLAAKILGQFPAANWVSCRSELLSTESIS